MTRWIEYSLAAIRAGRSPEDAAAWADKMEQEYLERFDRFTGMPILRKEKK